MTTDLQLPVRRRTLVAGAGAASLVGGVAGLPGAALAAAAAPSLAVRVGVLVPAGLSHAGAGQSLLDGLATGFAQARATVTVTSRPVSAGHTAAQSAADELIAGGVDVLVAGVSSPVATGLGAACTAAGVGLVVANAGAHFADDEVAVQSSLQHWQSSLRMGEWAARHLGRTLFTIVAVPDAGYDTVFAVRRGFTSAGGEWLGRSLTHERPEDDATLAAARAAKRSRADVVAVSASGRRAGDVLRALRAVGVKAAVVVDSLALEDFAVDRLGRAAGGVHSVASWTATQRTPAADAFAAAYRAATGRRPDAYAALGHDTALLVAEGGRRLDGAAWSGLRRALAGAKVAGVRGQQQVHRSRGTVSTPLAVRETRLRNGRPRTEVVAARPRVAGVPASMELLDGAEVAAYVNEYLGT